MMKIWVIIMSYTNLLNIQIKIAKIVFNFLFLYAKLSLPSCSFFSA